MSDPAPTFRRKRLDSMSLEELREARELILHNGAWYKSRDDHMRMLAVVDEHIAKAKRAPSVS